MKKKIVFILIMIMAVVMAAGCSSGKADTAEKNGPPAAETTAEKAADNNTTEPNLIGEDRAKKIALHKVKGADKADITEFHLDEDKGRKEYEGELRYDGKEYDFEIDAITGDIVSWEEETHQ